MEDKTLHAVIEVSGKQYLVKSGDKITTDKVELKEGEKLVVKEVLLITDGVDTKVGTPFVEKAAVTLDFEGSDKADKIRVFKYKSKSRYRKVRGHRQDQSHFVVTSIKQ